MTEELSAKHKKVTLAATDFIIAAHEGAGGRPMNKENPTFLAILSCMSAVGANIAVLCKLGEFNADQVSALLDACDTELRLSIKEGIEFSRKEPNDE